MTIGIPRQTRLTSWDGDMPENGDYLRTARGTTYSVLSVRLAKPGAKSVATLWIWRLEPDEAVPDGAKIHSFMWNSRKAKR